MLFYGSAAILIREITRLWGKSWPTILAFGAAYGICEEGLSTKVFFDLHRTNLGPQMQYGTWAGVHWPYMFHLITAHAVFSIAVPIFLTMLLFPDQAVGAMGAPADTPCARCGVRRRDGVLVARALPAQPGRPRT